MSVLIKNMKMPDTCEDCNLESFCDLWVDARKMCGEWKPGVKATIRHPDCPLVYIPPHGRLIDENDVKVLLTEMVSVGKDIINSQVILEWVADNLTQCPTVIPAKEEA